MGFPGNSDSKESACNAGDPGSIPGSGRSPEGHGNPLQYPCLENPMDEEPWWVTVHGVAQSRTRLSMHPMCVSGLPRQPSGQRTCLQCRRCRSLGFDPRVRDLLGEGCGNPLQYPCLENPMDRGAWRATVCGITKSRALLKQLSVHRI